MKKAIRTLIRYHMNGWLFVAMDTKGSSGEIPFVVIIT